MAWVGGRQLAQCGDTPVAPASVLATPEPIRLQLNAVGAGGIVRERCYNALEASTWIDSKPSP